MGPKDLLNYDRKKHRLEPDPDGTALLMGIWNDVYAWLSKVAAYIPRIV